MKHRALTITDTAEQAEASAWLDSVLPASVSLVVFIGGGLGHMIEALERRHPDAKAVVLEPDPDVARALASRSDWAAWIASGRLAVLAGPAYAGAAAIAKDFPGLSAAPVLVHPKLERTHPAAVATARGAIEKLAFQASANEGARRATAGRYLLQTLANAPRLAREGHIGALENLFAGMPTVVVAAGPSLDRNVHELRAVKDRVLIVACDTAARPLVLAGIEPHVIVATDASRANAAHLSSLPPSKSWLVAEGSLHSSAFAHFDRRTFAFRVADHEPWPWLQTLGLDAPRLDTWGSVATCAFSLALRLGGNPIAFMGADFAFTGGRPYCRGTSFESLWGLWHGQGSSLDDIWRTLRDRWTSTSSVTAIDGSPVETAPHLISFRDWVVERAAQFPGRRVVNATGAGILAGGSIEQSGLWPFVADADTIDRTLVDRVFAAAHQATRGDLGRVLAGANALLAESQDAAIARWIDFAAGSINESAIQMALRSPELEAWRLGAERAE